MNVAVNAFHAFANTLATVSRDEVEEFASLVSRQRTRVADALVAPLIAAGTQRRRTPASVVYGVLLERRDGSLTRLYVGESVSGLRRMWDLPIGESHHVASRIPPEAWARVIVVRWPFLIERLRDEDPTRLVDLENIQALRVVNRLIESHLNRELAPLFDVRRTRDGTFQRRSRGTIPLGAHDALCQEVLSAWNQLEVARLSVEKPCAIWPWGYALSPRLLLSSAGFGSARPRLTSGIQEL
jgi:hypothetical protein